MTVAGLMTDYWTCNACWHIWSVKRDTGETIQHVTPLSRPKA
jgi:hypothetical protein